jgi:hypothetical protein
MREFEMVASLNGEIIKGLALPVLVMDEDFFEYLEEENIDAENGLDILDFALYYEQWERENVK